MAGINIQFNPIISGGTQAFQTWAKKNKLKLDVDDSSFIRPLGKMRREANLFESALEASNARVLAFGASVAVLNSVSNAMRALARDTINVEKSLEDINRILKVSNDTLNNFGNSLFKIAEQTASSFDEVSRAALEFSRQGLALDEVLKRTEKTLTFVRLTGLDAAKAVQLLTATVNAFNDIEIDKAVNKFVAVETQFAVSARDLVEGLSRVGSAAVDAKVDLDELNALVTAVQETTGRGGPVIGNALKTIFTRLQRTDTLEALESFNIAIRDVQGNTLPAVMILKEFANSYSALTDASKAYLREQVAGVFQGNILSAILKDLTSEQERYSKALEVSKNASNEAEMANARLNRTLSALLAQTTSELTKFNQNIGEEVFEPIARNLLGGFKKTLQGLNTLLDGDSENLGSFLAKGFLKGFENILSGPVLVGIFAVISKAAFNTARFITQAVPALLHITTLSEKRKNTESHIMAILNSQNDMSKAILSGKMSELEIADMLVMRAQQLTNLEQKKVNIAKSMSAFIVPRAQSAYIYESGLIGGQGRMKKPPVKASGYLPSISEEQKNIKNGVGGASSKDYPVVIKNFPFGGGKTGDIVANSSEFIVPNFDKKGGAAIFNQNMIKGMGLPKGALPIAADGYEPPETEAEKLKRKEREKLEAANSSVENFLKNKYKGTQYENQKSAEKILNEIESKKQKEFGPSYTKINISDLKKLSDVESSIKSQIFPHTLVEGPPRSSEVKATEGAKKKARRSSRKTNAKKNSDKQKSLESESSLENEPSLESSVDNPQPPSANESKVIEKAKKQSRKRAKKITKAKIEGQKEGVKEAVKEESFDPGDFGFGETDKEKESSGLDDFGFGETEKEKESAIPPINKQSTTPTQEQINEAKKKIFSSESESGPQSASYEPSAKSKATSQEKLENLEALREARKEILDQVEQGKMTTAAAAKRFAVVKAESGALPKGEKTKESAYFSELLNNIKEKAEIEKSNNPPIKKLTAAQIRAANQEDVKSQLFEVQKKLESGAITPTEATTSIENLLSRQDLPFTKRQAKEQETSAKKKIKESTKNVLNEKIYGKGGLLESVEAKTMSPQEAISAIEGSKEFSYLSQQDPKSSPTFLKKIQDLQIQQQSQQKAESIEALRQQGLSVIKDIPKMSKENLTKASKKFSSIKSKLRSLDEKAADNLAKEYKKVYEQASLGKLNQEVGKKYRAFLKKVESGKIDIGDSFGEAEKILKEKGFSKKASKQDMSDARMALQEAIARKLESEYTSKEYESALFTDPSIKGKIDEDLKKLKAQYGLNSSVMRDLNARLNLFSDQMNFASQEFNIKYRNALSENISALRKGSISLRAAEKNVYQTIIAEKRLTREKQALLIRQSRAELRALRDAKELRDKQTKGFSTGASFALAMGAPMLAGFAQQGILGNRERFELSKGERISERFIGAGTTAAGLGGSIGGSIAGMPGAIVGAAVGGLGGFIYALMTATKSLDEMREAVDATSDKTNENLNIIDSRIKMIKEYAENPNPTSLDKLKYRNALNQNLLSIKDKDLRSAVSGGGADIAALEQAKKNYERQRGKLMLIQQLGVAGKSFEYKDFKSGEKTNEDVQFAKAILEDASFKRIDNEYFGQKSKEEAANIFGQFSKFFGDLSTEEVKKLEKESKKGIKDFATMLVGFSKVLDKEDLGALTTSLEEGFDLKVFQDIFGNLQELIDYIREQNKDIVEQSDKSRENYIRIKESFTRMAELSDENAKSLQLSEKYLASFYDNLNSIVSGSAMSERLKNEIQYTKNLESLGSQRIIQEQSFIASNSGKLTEALFKAVNKTDDNAEIIKDFQKRFAVDPLTALNTLKKDIENENFVQNIQGEDTIKLKELVNELYRTYEFQRKNIDAEFKILVEQNKINEKKADIVEQERLNQVALQKFNLNSSINQKIASSRSGMEVNALQFRISQNSASPLLTDREKAQKELAIRQKIFNEEKDLIQKEASFKEAILNKEMEMELNSLKSQSALIDSNIDLIDSIKEFKYVIEKSQAPLIASSEIMSMRMNPKVNESDIPTWESLTEQKIKEIDSRQTTEVEIAKKIKSQAKERIELIKEETKALYALRKEDISTDPLLKIDDKIHELSQEREKLDEIINKRTFGRGIKSGFATIKNDVENFHQTIGNQIPLSFRNNMVDALNAAMDGAKDLDEALRDAAIGFLTEIRNAFTQKAVGDVMTGFNTVFSRQSGGPIKAQNGMYISGSRTGDKNPALLEDGEYVLNRNAVRAMGGPSALDRLNFNIAPRFANGGSATLNKSLGDKDFSGFFYANPNAEMQELRDYYIQQEKDRLAKKMKQRQFRNAIITTAASAVVSGATGYIGNRLNTNTPNSYGPQEYTEPQQIDVDKSLRSYSFSGNQKGGHISMGFANKDSVPVFAAGGEYMMNNKAVRKYGIPYMERLNGGYIPAYQSGGAVSSSDLGSSNQSSIKTEINIYNNGETSVKATGASSDVEQQKQLGQKIESAVRKVIQEEQRSTGLLSRGGRRV